MGVKYNSSGGGSVTLDAPSTASNLTVTLPSASGTLAVTSGTSFADITVTGNSYFATSSGSVGIGTSSPSYKLDVVSNSNSIQAQRIYNANSGSSAFAVQWFGNDISATQAGVFVNSSTNTAYGGGGSLNLYQGGAYPIAFSTNNTERMRIDSSGNVGIGTSTMGGGASMRMSLNGTYGGGIQQAFNNNGGSALIPITGGGLQFFTYTGAFGSESYSERMRIDSSGNLLVGVTSATSGGGVIQVSNGITFPATQSASSDANTLDDYEEGTWTPTVYGASSAGTTTYTNQDGKYTKIGNCVTAIGRVRYTAATGTGDLVIGGLPFTASSINSPFSVMTDGYNWNGTVTYIMGFVTGNNTYVQVYGCADDASLVRQSMTNETVDWYFTATYFV